MLHAVIMAGGAGTRFWPASRSAMPKQLLRLVGQRTMLQSTVDRLGNLVPASRALVVTNARLVEPIQEQLPDLPPASILGEPCKRDTAPCIGWAAMHLARHDADAIMAIMPSDHVIATDEQFRAAIRHAASLVESDPGRLVTFGIRPTYPAEIFGYIERGEPLPQPGEPATYHVLRFREKPSAKVAQEFLESGSFYWNSGVFVWKAQTILDLLAEFEPELFKHLAAICAAMDQPDYSHVLDREFNAIRGVSIDYAVMERAQKVLVVEAPFRWDDLGSWQSMARLRGTDEHGNTIDAKHIALDTRDSIIRGPDDHLIVTLGLKDALVVHTPDATLVADKHREESIRQVVRILEEHGWTEYL